LPVVAFNVAGLPDAILHRRTGYLASPYDPADLAFGIRWILERSERTLTLSNEARDRATSLWSPEIVSAMHLELYSHILSLNNCS